MDTQSSWDVRFEEIDMNAEIGGYQGDVPDGNDPIVVPEDVPAACE